MLKSTHKPSVLAPLPAGWTEHKAPTGHTYYHNSTTKQSTYTRPAPPTSNPIPPRIDPSQSFLQYQAVSNPTPDVRSGFRESLVPSQGERRPDVREGPFHKDVRRRPQPNDKPISRQPIPNYEPWVLVHTKYGRRFVYNAEKDQSFWRIPEKLKEGILALDQQRIKEKAAAAARQQKEVEDGAPKSEALQAHDAGDSSEYEEVEVTDDEDEDNENPAKRQRTEHPIADEPVEFNEDDIAYQLAAMGQDYGLDPEEYGEGDEGEWDEGADGVEISEEDSVALFKDLLNDFGINPYSPWEKLIEEGKLVDDIRYTALPTMKSRKEVWEEWSREKIKILRESRSKQEKKDPAIPYLAFLQKHATPKLYWPEFKRKFRKEDEMKNSAMSDKEREKLYREHISRLKLPQSTLKSDLSALLKAQPLSLLNQATLSSNLPSTILSKVTYISLDSSIRDPLIEGYISTLPPAPDSNQEEGREEVLKERMEKDRRQKALEERERRVAEEKRKQQRNLEFGKGRLREEEAEIARAMNVSKKGLRDHLVDGDAEAAS